MNSVMHHIPKVSSVRLKSSVFLPLNSLNTYQRQVVSIQHDLFCVDDSGRILTCNNTVRGGELNHTHSLLIMENAVVHPDFVNLVNYAFSSMQVTSSSYLLEQTIWFDSDLALGSPAVQHQVLFKTHILSSFHNHDVLEQQMVAAFKAVIHNQSQSSNSISTIEEVLTEDITVKIGYHWLNGQGEAARLSALDCMEASPTLGTIMDESGFTSLGKQRCPDSGVFRCLENFLSSVSDYGGKGVECTVMMRVLHNADIDLSESLQAALRRFPLAEIQSIDTSALQMSHTFDVMKSYSDFAAALHDAVNASSSFTRLASRIVFDSGVQSTAVLTMLTDTALSSAGSGLDWRDLLFSANFSTVQAWEVNNAGFRYQYDLLLLSFLDQNVSSSFQTGEVLLNFTGDTFTVQNYIMGSTELLSSSRALCAYTGCDECEYMQLVTGSQRLHGQVLLHEVSWPLLNQTLKKLPPRESLVCNSTQTSVIVIDSDVDIPFCTSSVFISQVIIQVPLPPAIVLSFMLDAILNAAAEGVHILDYHVQPSSHGSLVTLFARAETQESCISADFLQLNLLTSAFANIWPLTFTHNVSTSCHVTCRNESMIFSSFDIQQPNATFSCKYDFDIALPLPARGEMAVLALQDRIQPTLQSTEFNVLFNLSSQIQINTTCNLSQMQNMFESVHASEYVLDKPSSSQLYHEYSVWNAQQRQDCWDGRACAHALNVSAENGGQCLRVSALNVHLSAQQILGLLLKTSSTTTIPAIDMALASNALWMSNVAYQKILPVLTSYEETKSIHIVMEEGVLLQHYAEIERKLPFSRFDEHFILASLPKHAQVTWNNLVVFNLFTVSSLQDTLLAAEKVNFVATALESLLPPSHGDISFRFMTHTALSSSVHYNDLSADQRLLVDKVESEIMISATFATNLSCAEFQQVLQSITPFPLPLVDSVYLHILSDVLECTTNLYLLYHETSCSERFVFVQDTVNETCVEKEAWKNIVVTAHDDALFFKTLDIVQASSPTHHISYEFEVMICDETGGLSAGIDAMTSQYGKCICFALNR